MKSTQNRTPKTDAQLGADLAARLSPWYSQNRRDLPWRLNRDPYRIWLSEVMLQQTTVTAVIPYYERFLGRFPDLKSLATAEQDEVLKYWTGLGYYSRARNLHKAAQVLHTKGWPQDYRGLLDIPGFGPYTARAVSSLAFGEKVGVVDGNVIRVLSRVRAQAIEHWTPKGRDQLQAFSDLIAVADDPSLINQGLMELGATICTPKKTQCLLCPWLESCEAHRLDQIEALPLKKPRKEIQTWVWQPEIFRRGNSVGLVQNEYAPFLKNQWLFPGRAELKSAKPKKFDLRHGITHHDIYVQISKPASTPPKGLKWVKIEDLTNWNPSILLRKTLDKSVD